MIKKMIIGNWKMNKNKKDIMNFLKKYSSFNKNQVNDKFDYCYGIASPFVYLDFINNLKDKELDLYAQNCHFEENGAYTGDISFKMLLDIGVNKSIIGHSEVRKFNYENDFIINKKLKILLKNNFQIVLCIGEDIDDFLNKKTQDKISLQLKNDCLDLGSIDDIHKNLIIAYEPIWAIGAGKSASLDIINNVVIFIRDQLKILFGNKEGEKIKILYGGSVNQKNAKEIINNQNIDGLLVGGASLDADIFFSLFD
jgi:triosephosphate isomerase (TIM)